jgi:hypothetical protein
MNVRKSNYLCSCVCFYQRNMLSLLSLLLLLSVACPASLGVATHARIYSDTSDNLHIESSASDQDVVLGNVSINSMTSTIHALTSENTRMLAVNSNLAATASVLAASLDVLEYEYSSQQIVLQQLSQTLASLSASECPARLTTCAISQSAQILALQYHSFASFTSDNKWYLAAQRNESSTLFVWNCTRSSFSRIQSIEAPQLVSAGTVTSFSFDGQQYVLFSFRQSNASLPSVPRFFKFNATQQLLVAVQGIPDLATFGSATMDIGGIFYIFVSSFSAPTSNNLSQLLRYDSNTQSFVNVQNLTLTAALIPDSFNIDATAYLAIPSHSSNQSNNAVSHIYKFDEKVFVEFQGIQTVGCTHIKHVHWRSQHYLLVAQYEGGFIDVYVYNQSQHIFVNHTGSTRVFTSRPLAVDTVVINNELYIAVGTYLYGNGNVVNVYKWTEDTTQFVLYQQLHVSPWWCVPLFTRVGVDVYLAVSDHIFKWCFDKFV